VSALRILAIAAFYVFVGVFVLTVVIACMHLSYASNGAYAWLVAPVTIGGIHLWRLRVPRIVDPTGECTWVDTAGLGGVSLVVGAAVVVNLLPLSVGATALVGALGFGVGASLFLGAVLMRSGVLDPETVERDLKEPRIL
jgi:hypothetical protein